MSPSKLEITTTTEDGTVILSPSGRLDSRTASRLSDALAKPMEESVPGLIIDFSEIAFISSAGLRVVLATAKQAKRNGTALALCSLQKDTHEVFAISGLLNVLPIHDDLAAAKSATQAS